MVLPSWRRKRNRGYFQRLQSLFKLLSRNKGSTAIQRAEAVAEIRTSNDEETREAYKTRKIDHEGKKITTLYTILEIRGTYM
jgi:hypothetical protein